MMEITIRDVLVFWGGLSVGVVLVQLLRGPRRRGGYQPTASRRGPIVPPPPPRRRDR